MGILIKYYGWCGKKGSEIEYVHHQTQFYLFSSELFQNQALPYQQKFYAYYTKNIKFSVKKGTTILK